MKITKGDCLGLAWAYFGVALISFDMFTGARAINYLGVLSDKLLIPIW